MMTDNTCTIMNIPDNIWPVDVAMGMTEIDSTMVSADWEDRHFGHTNATLAEDIKEKLHPDIKNLCEGKIY